jgi:hypothetical protein
VYLRIVCVCHLDNDASSNLPANFFSVFVHLGGSNLTRKKKQPKAPQLNAISSLCSIPEHSIKHSKPHKQHGSIEARELEVEIEHLGMREYPRGLRQLPGAKPFYP